jgi:hypothetical protein
VQRGIVTTQFCGLIQRLSTNLSQLIFRREYWVFRVLVGIITSVNGVLIRLTEERWGHITAQHLEMEAYQTAILDVVANPDRLLDSGNGQPIAVRSVSQQTWLLVVYRGLEAQGAIVDGFIVTASFNQRLRYLEGKKQL